MHAPLTSMHVAAVWAGLEEAVIGDQLEHPIGVVARLDSRPMPGPDDLGRRAVVRERAVIGRRALVAFRQRAEVLVQGTWASSERRRALLEYTLV